MKKLIHQKKEQIIHVLGIDVAKNVFQLHGVNVFGKTILKKKISRSGLKQWVALLPPCLIGMEACAGTHYWARVFQELGHQVKLMPPQYVKPYVKSNKNDALDAEAICEAVTRPQMRFVSIKTPQQQSVQSVHRIRERLIKNRTALMNEIRGILLEHGIAISQGRATLNQVMAELLQRTDHNKLDAFTQEILLQLSNELYVLEENIQIYEKKNQAIAQSNEVCQRLQTIRGIGPLGATALVASIGDPQSFKNGRCVSAWLGLVPRQHSSGGKTKLLGISKRGNKYLRYLLIQGAHSVLRAATLHQNAQNRKVLQLKERLGTKRAAVAIANKNARIVWSLMTHGTSYQPAA